MICYSNNGLAMRHVDEGYTSGAGEVLSPVELDEAGLIAAFPLYEGKKAKESVKAQINTLENSITPRRRDEAILGIDNGWLANIRQQIATLRGQL